MAVDEVAVLEWIDQEMVWVRLDGNAGPSVAASDGCATVH